MKRIAVVCAPGIGDAIIFQIAAHQLLRHGYDVTTFSNHLPHFGGWANGNFLEQPDTEKIPALFSSFDAVFLQHDNSAKARKIHALDLPVYTFYGSHNLPKHGPLRLGFDYVCNQTRTMVDNVREAVETLFHLPNATSDNGMRPPQGLIYRRFKRRVAIHPLSGVEAKNWPREKFLKVAEWLDKEGYEPDFLIPPAEKMQWGGPELPRLESLASFIYESGYFIGNDSGPGHIASCLNIPHLIIAKDRREIQFWKPGWLPGTAISPPPWIPNWKKFRLREKYWKRFISINYVINKLEVSVLNN